MVHLLGWNNRSLVYNLICWVILFLCNGHLSMIDKTLLHLMLIWPLQFTLFLLCYLHICFHIHTLVTCIWYNTLHIYTNPNYIITKSTIIENNNITKSARMKTLGFWRLTRWSYDTWNPLSFLGIVMHLVDLESWSILITFK